MLKLIFLSFLAIAIFSCTSGDITSNNIEDFINNFKYDEFSNLKDIAVTERSRSFTEIVYIVDKFSGNNPVYFVTYNLSSQSVTNIDNTMLRKMNVVEYLDQKQIYYAVQITNKNKLYLLGVDSNGNIIVNPFYSESSPYFLRLKFVKGDSIIRMAHGYDYTLYKDNWYLNTKRPK